MPKCGFVTRLFMMGPKNVRLKPTRQLAEPSRGTVERLAGHFSSLIGFTQEDAVLTDVHFFFIYFLFLFGHSKQSNVLTVF